MTKLKKTLALLLTLAIVLSMAPVTALAAETEEIAEVSAEVEDVTKAPEEVYTQSEGAAQEAIPTELESPADEETPNEPEKPVESNEALVEKPIQPVALEGEAIAAYVVDSGDCGDNVTWTLDSAGTLTISGKGKMYDYTRDATAPWVYEDLSTTVVIEEGVTSIGEYAFYGCTNLTNVTIPKSVISIGMDAFCGCSLVNVTIPEGVTSIGEYAFYGCTNLTNVTIPKSVISINEGAFQKCSSMTHVTIPDGVTYIGGWIFADCTKLRSVEFGRNFSGVKGLYPFDQCTSLEKIYFKGDAFVVSTPFFAGITATAYYPTNNSTWTKEARESIGDCGNITWVKWNPAGMDSSEFPKLTKEHLVFVKSGAFEQQMANRWSDMIAEGLNTPTGNTGETLYNILNSASELTQCKSLSVFENPYDAIIADLILAQTDTELLAFEAEYKIAMSKQVSTLETLCKMYSDDWELHPEYKTYLEKLIDDPKSYSKNEPFYALCEKLFQNIMDEGQLNDFLNMYGKATDLVGALNAYSNVVEWVCACADYHSLVTAFINTSDDFKETLMISGFYMDKNAGKWYASQYETAVKKYLSFTNENLSDSDIADLLFQEYFTDGISRIADVFGNAIAKQTESWLAVGLGLSKEVATKIFAAIWAYDTGWSISEAITKNGDIMDCRELLRANYYLADSVAELTESYANILKSDATYSAAIQFDAAYNILRYCEIYSLSTYKDYLNYQQDSLVQSVLHSFRKFNASEIEIADLEIAKWRNATCHSINGTTAKAEISLSVCTVILSESSYIYDGKEKQPTVSVYNGSIALEESVDFTVSGNIAIDLGTYTITITGIGIYAGIITKTFTIRLATPAISKLENVNGGVKVTWGKVDGAEKYRLYVRSSDGWKKVTDTTSTSATFKGISAVSLKSGTTYRFTVKCVSADGKTATSAYDKTGKTITYIAQPVLSSAANSTSGVTVKWGKVTGAAKYRVFRKASGASKWDKLTDTTSTSYTDKTAKSGTTYIYTVRCITSDGKSYTSSYDAKGKTVLRLSNPEVTVGNAASGVVVKWGKVTGATGYYVYRKTGSGNYSKIATIKSGTTVSYTDTGVKSKNGTTYTYAVRAYSGSTLSAYTGKTMVRLTAPTISSVTNSASKSMTVKWNKNSSATGYQIRYKTGSTVKTVTVKGSGSLSKVISGLTKGSTYTVYVRSYKTVSGVNYYSAWSASKTVKISK